MIVAFFSFPYTHPPRDVLDFSPSVASLRSAVPILLATWFTHSSFAISTLLPYTHRPHRFLWVRESPSDSIMRNRFWILSPPPVKSLADGTRHRLSPPPVKSLTDGTRHRLSPPPVKSLTDGTCHRLSPPPVKSPTDGTSHRLSTHCVALSPP